MKHCLERLHNSLSRLVMRAPRGGTSPGRHASTSLSTSSSVSSDDGLPNDESVPDDDESISDDDKSVSDDDQYVSDDDRPDDLSVLSENLSVS